MEEYKEHLYNLKLNKEVINIVPTFTSSGKMGKPL